MSRTYRKHLDGEYIVNGQIVHWKDIDVRFPVMIGYHYRYRIIKGQRDRKPWNKPAKFFKQMNRRIERAQVNNALRNDKEIPIFKKHDQWDWT